MRVKPDQEAFDDLRHLDDGAFKAKGSYSSTNVNTSKIQKFIEKQKKRNEANKRKEQTIEHEKYLKVRQNLLNLHNYTTSNRLKTGTHSRQTSF